MFRKLFLIALMISIMVMGCNNKSIEDDTDQFNSTATATKLNHKERVITLGTNHYPPFQQIVDGEFKGPGTEVIMEVLDRLEYEYVFLEIPWPRMLEMMKSGALDIALDVYYNDERNEYIEYNRIAFGVFPQVFYTLNSSEIDYNGDFSSLSQYTIGTTRSYYYGENFDEAMKSGLIKIDECDSSKILFEKLKNNRIDIAADTLYTGSSLINELGITDDVRILEPHFDNLYSYLGFSRAADIDGLREEYDEMLAEVIRDGTLVKIYEKYNMGSIGELIAGSLK